MGKVNGVNLEHFYWTCPECEVTFINSTYCYKCDIIGDESEATEIEKEDKEES